jgi:hypothetical protein
VKCVWLYGCKTSRLLQDRTTLEVQLKVRERACVFESEVLRCYHGVLSAFICAPDQVCCGKGCLELGGV